MEFDIELYDENDIPYVITVEVEYDASPEEYEAGYYFAGGVEVYSNAKVLTVDEGEDDEGNKAVPNYQPGDTYQLDDSEASDFADKIRDSIASESRGGRYPRMNISPDW